MRKAVSFAVRFIKIWAFMAFSLILMKGLLNIFLYGRIDLRQAALNEMLFIPIGQAVLYWLFTWRRTRTPMASS